MDVKRVAVVGPGGAGKSTFARQLGEATGLPVIHLDRHYWKPGWVETPRQEWRQLQHELLSGEGWIADGNYGATFDIRFDIADTVIVLSLPRWRCTTRVLKRELRHLGHAVQAEGCPERVSLEFLRWIWRYPVESRPRLDRALEARRDRLTVVELTSAREVQAFLHRVLHSG